MKQRVRQAMSRRGRQKPPRTFVVGDIHGHAEKLRTLMPQLLSRAKTGDSLVFVGDYIDRGPDSKGVIDQILALRDGAWPGPVVTLKGNHEALMLDFLSPERQFDPQVWAQNGGLTTIHSYTGDGLQPDWLSHVPSAHLEFLHGLRKWHRDVRGIYVHAGLTPHVPVTETTEDICLWIRDPFIKSTYAWDRVVVFGHTPQRVRSRSGKEEIWQPLNRAEKIGIDTGAAYGGPLTAVVLPQREFFSAE